MTTFKHNGKETSPEIKPPTSSAENKPNHSFEALTVDFDPTSDPDMFNHIDSTRDKPQR